MLGHGKAQDGHTDPGPENFSLVLLEFFSKDLSFYKAIFAAQITLVELDTDESAGSDENDDKISTDVRSVITRLSFRP